MWLLLAFLSAALLGFYDTFKKKSLRNNAVIPVLFLNTLFSTLIFLPFIVFSASSHTLDGSMFYVPQMGWVAHRFILLKSVLVLSSWIFGYFAMKHLPLSIVGPINATRPVLVLVGALLVYGERLNLWQWAGVLLAILSFFLLSRSWRKEGIDFKHNRWIFCLIIAALLGAASGLFDKYLMASVQDGGVGLNRMVVQSWYNIYQMVLMGIILCIVWFPKRRQTTSFRWDGAIVFISIFLSLADFAYLYALSLPGAMISVVSMVRRGSVIVSFITAVFFFRERNVKAKAIDLLLVLLGMICLYIGSH